MGKDARPQLPSGTSPRMFFMRCVWSALWGGRFPFRDTDTVKVDNSGGFYSFNAKLSRGGCPAGWDWMYPDHKELDITLPYSAGKFVYISALNTLVTAGLTDIVSNSTVTSCQGIWQALQDIPAAIGGKFNVPTINYPSGAVAVGGSVIAPGTTAPSGTPLIGDMDLVNTTTGKKVRYWEYWGDITA